MSKNLLKLVKQVHHNPQQIHPPINPKYTKYQENHAQVHCNETAERQPFFKKQHIEERKCIDIITYPKMSGDGTVLEMTSSASHPRQERFFPSLLFALFNKQSAHPLRMQTVLHPRRCLREHQEAHHCTCPNTRREEGSFSYFPS